jgi:hypothetical protein
MCSGRPDEGRPDRHCGRAGARVGHVASVASVRCVGLQTVPRLGLAPAAIAASAVPGVSRNGLAAITMQVEPKVAPDCGGIRQNQSSKSHQPPQQVNLVVRRRRGRLMCKREKEQVYLRDNTLGDPAKATSDSPAVRLAPPDTCWACGAPLVMEWEFHAHGLWWSYASCAGCKLFFIRRSPARTSEEIGWLVESNPPEFLTNPNWVVDLKRSVADNC